MTFDEVLEFIISGFTARAIEAFNVGADDLLLSCRNTGRLWILNAKLKVVEISGHL